MAFWNTPTTPNPALWEGLEIPQILLSGDHKAIAKWKHGAAPSLNQGAPARPLGRNICPIRIDLCGLTRYSPPNSKGYLS